MRPIPEQAFKISARRSRSPTIGKQLWVPDNSLNRCRTVEISSPKNWGWHSTQIFSTDVSCSNRLKDGSINVVAEILISLTCPAVSALRRKECNAFAPIIEKSNMALLPVRAAIWITDGMISSGLQTKAMMGIRCSATMSTSASTSYIHLLIVI